MRRKNSYCCTCCISRWLKLFIIRLMYVMIIHKMHACINWLPHLTRTVNFPVCSSLSKGSWVGCNTANPSLLLVASCCSYRAKARWTSNFRAAKNLTAVLQDTGPARLPALHLFTASINSFVAWKKNCYMHVNCNLFRFYCSSSVLVFITLKYLYKYIYINNDSFNI